MRERKSTGLATSTPARAPLAWVSLLAALLGFVPPLQAQHGHLNAGAVGTGHGDKLMFANGADFAASSGYVKELPYINTGPYAGYFEGGITLTALPQTIDNGGPVPGAPAPGSFIQVRLMSLSGPFGGTPSTPTSTRAPKS